MKTHDGASTPLYLYLPPVTYYLSPVTCYLSPVTCHLSPVTHHQANSNNTGQYCFSFFLA